jgi:hypothetical protein
LEVVVLVVEEMQEHTHLLLMEVLELLIQEVEEEVVEGTSTSGAGGKGVVILSVPTASYSSTTTGSPTVTTSGQSNTIITIYRYRELHSIMASFAKIGLNNKVIEVLSVHNNELLDSTELNKKLMV